MRKQNVRTISLIVCTFTYILVGAAVFDALEADHEREHRRYLKERLESFKQRHNVTDADFTQLEANVKAYEPYKAGHQWKFAGAFYFSMTVITTIGYGHSTPRTVGGKWFCMFYALGGIPLNLVMFQSIGERLNVFVSFLLRNIKRCFKCANHDVSQTDLILIALNLSVVVLIFGAAIFSKREDWSYLDAFYYCFITLTTVGFGDIVALQTNNTLDNRLDYVIFTIAYILFGLSVLSAGLNLLVLRMLTMNTEDERRDQIEAEIAAQEVTAALLASNDLVNKDVDLEVKPGVGTGVKSSCYTLARQTMALSGMAHSTHSYAGRRPKLSVADAFNDYRRRKSMQHWYRTQRGSSGGSKQRGSTSGASGLDPSALAHLTQIYKDNLLRASNSEIDHDREAEEYPRHDDESHVSISRNNSSSERYNTAAGSHYSIHTMGGMDILEEEEDEQESSKEPSPDNIQLKPPKVIEPSPLSSIRESIIESQTLSISPEKVKPIDKLEATPIAMQPRFLRNFRRWSRRFIEILRRIPRYLINFLLCMGPGQGTPRTSPSFSSSSNSGQKDDKSLPKNDPEFHTKIGDVDELHTKPTSERKEEEQMKNHAQIDHVYEQARKRHKAKDAFDSLFKRTKTEPEPNCNNIAADGQNATKPYPLSLYVTLNDTRGRPYKTSKSIDTGRRRQPHYTVRRHPTSISHLVESNPTENTVCHGIQPIKPNPLKAPEKTGKSEEKLLKNPAQSQNYSRLSLQFSDIMLNHRRAQMEEVENAVQTNFDAICNHCGTDLTRTGNEKPSYFHDKERQTQNKTLLPFYNYADRRYSI